PRVAAQWPYIPPHSETHSGAYYAPAPKGSFGLKVLGVLAGAGVTFLILLFLSANKANAGFSPAQLRDVLMGTANGEVDRPPPLPAPLAAAASAAIDKPAPAAVAADPTADGAPESSSEAAKADAAASTGRNEDFGDAHVVQIKRSQTAFEIARTYLGQSNW